MADAPPTTATYLDGILAWHRARAASDERDPAALQATALGLATPPRDFAAALGARRRGESRVPTVIAEIKRRSPSKGPLAMDLVPGEIAEQYSAGGAGAVSVLTDAEHFSGSVDDLRAARRAVTIPILRKDFTVSANDVCDTRLMGADAVLLIVAALGTGELRDLTELALALGLTALVEVHDEEEADQAMAAGASVIGVNQRDLRTFAVDTARALRLAAYLPDDVLKVAESGITSGLDVARLAEAGYDGVLIGETLVCSPNRTSALTSLVRQATEELDRIRAKVGNA